MATQLFSRSRLPKTLTISSFFSRSLSTATSAASLSEVRSRSSQTLLHRLRPLAGVIASAGTFYPASTRCLATSSTTSSLRDPNPNWTNRPPKETILLDGCDFQHWLVVMEPPEGDPTRDDIIDSYIKTLAMVLGSEEEARKNMYSVSTRCYFAFGALVSEEVSLKIKELPKVRWVLPDSYLNVREKDYGGEPFIDGKAVPYDPKYHEEWLINYHRANDRRRDRPSRNFDRRRENIQSRDYRSRGPAPMPNQAPGPYMAGPANNMAPPPPNRMAPPPTNNMGPLPPRNMSSPNSYNNVQPSNNWNSGPPNNYNQMPPSNYNQMPPNSYSQMPPSNYNQMPPSNYNQMPPSNYNQMPPNSYSQMPPSNYNQMPPNNIGGPANDIAGDPSKLGGTGWSSPGQYQNNYPERNNVGVPSTNRY